MYQLYQSMSISNGKANYQETEIPRRLKAYSVGYLKLFGFYLFHYYILLKTATFSAEASIEGCFGLLWLG